MQKTLAFSAALAALVALPLLVQDDVADAHHRPGHGSSQPMQITSFHAVATVQGTVTPIAFCEGVDGTYTLLHVVGSGPITSDDPRMSGTFHADALILDHPVTGLGVSRDDWTITDPTTGDVKATGLAVATNLGPNPIAISIARLADGSRVVTNSVVTLPAPGSSDPIVIEYGGPGLDVPDRGVIVSGGGTCVDVLFSQMP